MQSLGPGASWQVQHGRGRGAQGKLLVLTKGLIKAGQSMWLLGKLVDRHFPHRPEYGKLVLYVY